MKILYVVNYFAPSTGAAAINTLNISKYLEEFGHELLVLAPGDMGQSLKLKSKNAILEKLNLKVSYSNSFIKAPVSYVVSHFENMIKYLVKIRPCFFPDIILSQYHAHHFASVIGGYLSKLLKLPHIVRSHDIFNSRSDIFPYSIYHKSTYSQIFRSISSAKIFYANSSEMMDYFIQMKKFEDVDFKVHHNGVDTEKFYPSKNQEVLKSKFGADVILLTVGGLIEDYGIHKFIKLFPEILKQYKDTHIVLVGDGYYKKFIHDYAQNHGIIKNVHLLGVKPHQQIPFYINNCDVGIGRITDNKFIKYSISSKCLEFMACGKPFITAPLSKDLIDNNDVGIKLRRNHTKKELLDAFITLIEDKDLRKNLGEKGLNKVKSHFEWNQIMRAFNNDLQKYIP